MKATAIDHHRPADHAAEDALPATTRLRAALLGIALATLAVALAVLLALLILTGPFHTSPADVL